MSAKIAARLHSQGKKRMLALDGGGTRGIITIAFLKRIEAVLAERFVEKGWYARPEDFRLCHYFDLIGGTSVGSMLAAQLALGHSVSEIETNFEATAKLIFSRPTMSAPRWGIFKPQFEAGPVTRAIKGIVQDECLDSDKLRTGLAIIMKRMDTGSV